MRVDLITPSGQRESSVLRDGEKVEVSRDRNGERLVILRVRRKSKGYVEVELMPEAEETPRERIRLHRPA